MSHFSDRQKLTAGRRQQLLFADRQLLVTRNAARCLWARVPTQPETGKEEYSKSPATPDSASNRACPARRSSPYPSDRPRLSRARESGSKSNSLPHKHPWSLITLVN